MPVGGEIIEVNPKLEDTPEIANQDAYGEGWMIKIKMNDSSQLNDLLSSKEYRKIIGV
jgi:glycine cleavage system H protein